MNHDNPHALARPLPFRNVSEETIPAFAVMTVAGLTSEHGLAFLQCGKPNATFRRHYAVNGMQDVLPGRRGSCFRAGDVRVLYDADTPEAGAGWGPKPGQWTLARGFPGGTIQGIVDATHKIARIDCEPINRALVKTTATVAIDSSTTDYRVYAGVPDSEVDAGFTDVPPALNRSGQVIASGQWAYLVWVHNGWELQLMRQAALCAVPPCGQGIPARVGNEPGQNECCLFTIAAGALVPVLNDGGAQARDTVYNVRDVAIPPLQPPDESYVLVHADPSGRWICEVPENGSAAGGAAATTTTPDPNQPPCAGTCKWSWSFTYGGAWHLESDTCGTTTTTTPDPQATTTPPSCLCPTTTTTTTTCDPEEPECTTTTTTTTAEPECSCAYPAFCGSETGECTYTSCAAGTSAPTVDCTTTTTAAPTTTPDPLATTTTCDCNTTTTMSPETGCSNCTWSHHPVGGWVNTFNGCHGQCSCAAPPGAPGDCSSATTACLPIVVVPPPPPPPCGGSCSYICVPGSGWFFVGGSCSGGTHGCFCGPPTENCTVCGAPARTPCYEPPANPDATTTTAAPGPCAECYGTTTTTTTAAPTTTTPDPCGSGCLWDGSASGAWAAGANNCAVGCNCLPPAYTATDDCETAHTKCFPVTTTTVGPTTTPPPTTPPPTTTTAAPYYCDCFEPEFDTGNCVQGLGSLTSFNCGGPFATLALCQAAAPCDNPPTTTPPPTTTTPAPQFWRCCGSPGCSEPSVVQCAQVASAVDPCPAADCNGAVYDTEALCVAAGCAPATTTCDPLAACDGASQCAVACSNFIYVLNDFCPPQQGGACRCDLPPEAWAVLGQPCTESLGAFACCNGCPGSVAPCTNTTPAP